MDTHFALARLDVDLSDKEKLSFWFDGNSKVTVGNGTYEHPVPNSFSLVQVQDCPFATPTCTSVCYIHNLEKEELEIHEKYQHNSQAIRIALSRKKYQDIVEVEFANWIRGHCKKGFRWHVSGDIFSPEYAYFILTVCRRMPEIMSWIYTRSYDYIGPLLKASNLVVNLSADKDNYQKALALNKKYGLRICYLTVEGEVPELPVGSVIFPSYELRGRDLANPTQAPWWQSLRLDQKRMVCPPDFFGQSESFRCGPCKKCLT